MNLHSLITGVVLAGWSAAGAFTGGGTLTLVAPGTTNNNKLSITVSVTDSGVTASDNEVTTVSGTLEGLFDTDPATGATKVFTITGGNVAMSDMNFVLRAVILIFPVTVAQIQTTGMGGTAYTPAPPGVVMPTANGGTFDAAQHRVVINRGTMSGAVTITDPDTPVNADFAAAPTEGNGMGTGSITMTPGSSDATHRTMAATVVLPVDFADTQVQGTSTVTIKVQGTIRATGNIRIPLNDWVEWTQQKGLAGLPFDGGNATGGMPLGLAWAAGFDPGSPAVWLTPRMAAGEGGPRASVVLPAGGTRAPVWVEVSPSLADGSWVPAPAAALSTGANPLPVGTAGTVTVDFGDSPDGFVRLRASPP
jgi:hypothetical protein